MTVVTAAIIYQSGRYLIARRAPGQKLEGRWEFCGGKVEEGETDEECLARELFEELEITAVIGDFFTETLYRYDHGEFLLKAYEIVSYEGNFRPTVHDRLEWVFPEQIFDFDLLPADVPIARKIIKKAKNV